MPRYAVVIIVGALYLGLVLALAWALVRNWRNNDPDYFDRPR